MEIPARLSSYEADPEVAHHALDNDLIAVTSDSDLLAYGPSEQSAKNTKLRKLMIVSKYKSDCHRIIDLESAIDAGKYLLFDLYRKYGRIIFQLYAGVSGCDFTLHYSGIPQVGIAKFIRLVSELNDVPSAKNLASRIWKEYPSQATATGITCEQHAQRHLQQVVDVYSKGEFYDGDSNTVDFSGQIIEPSTAQSKQHMSALANSRSREPFDVSLAKSIESFDVAQLLHKSMADVSTIRGVQLPENKRPEQCRVSELRDFVAARGGKISLNKPALVAAARQYLFLEKEVSKVYVDRNPDPNGLMYASVSTSSTRKVKDILDELHSKLSRMSGSDEARGIVALTHRLFHGGQFEEKYDNIVRIAPKLKDAFIY